MTDDFDLFGHPALERQSSDGLVRTDGGTDEWLTPRSILDPLGPFDLDPCSPGDRRPWDTATTHYDAQQNGLRQSWRGRVWLNPPYSNVGTWLARLADHADLGGDGIAFVFARTETAAWQDHVWPRATGVLFLRGRVTFCRVDGKPGPHPAGAPSALIAYGGDRTLEGLPLPGAYVTLGPRVKTR